MKLESRLVKHTKDNASCFYNDLNQDSNLIDLFEDKGVLLDNLHVLASIHVPFIKDVVPLIKRIYDINISESAFGKRKNKSTLDDLDLLIKKLAKQLA